MQLVAYKTDIKAITCNIYTESTNPETEFCRVSNQCTQDIW